MPAGAGGRLPSGRHGLPPELVAQNQRERIVTALVDCLAERGYAATTVTQIITAAGVSRATFYVHFADKEACFLTAHEMVIGHIDDLMREAAGEPGPWPEKVRACLASLLAFFAGEPELARIVVIEPIAAGGEAAERNGALLRRFAKRLRAGRELAGVDEELPESIEETLVGGSAALIAREVGAGRAGELERLLPRLVAFALAPYVGAPEAARVAASA